MAKIGLELEKWNVPNVAVVKDNGGPRSRERQTIPVADLPADVLREMAHDWLAALYDKAGKSYDWRFE